VIMVIIMKKIKVPRKMAKNLKINNYCFKFGKFLMTSKQLKL
jgi:hypothetical protein